MTTCAITDFKEKPAQRHVDAGAPRLCAGLDGQLHLLADVLVEELRRAHELGESDFGRHLLPRMARTRRLFAYDFANNVIPGLADYEEPGYWRDVGTIDAYFDAHMDTSACARSSA